MYDGEISGGAAAEYGIITARRDYKTVFCCHASRLRLAFEDFRLAKERYPTELAELVPDCIAAVPLDPYDGEPIRYNSEHGYFWTPGPDGTFEGKVDFDEDGYPRWRNHIQRHLA